MISYDSTKQRFKSWPPKALYCVVSVCSREGVAVNHHCTRRNHDNEPGVICTSIRHGHLTYGSDEGPPRVAENRNLLSHPDDLRIEGYVVRMT